jgi:hypothetical protein
MSVVTTGSMCLISFLEDGQSFHIEIMVGSVLLSILVRALPFVARQIGNVDRDQLRD